MYEFLTGDPPATTDLVPEPPGQVTVAGRAVLFPENVGYDGATVEVWQVDPATGHRVGSRPRASFPIDEGGQFGPVRVNGRQHYEFAIVRPSGGAHHFYVEPFVRSDHFLRLNSSRPGGPLDAIIPDSDETTNLVITRMRELWGDQGSDSDRLVIDGTDVVLPATSPRSGVNLAMFVHDDGLDGITDLGKGELFPFNLLSFPDRRRRGDPGLAGRHRVGVGRGGAAGRRRPRHGRQRSQLAVEHGQRVGPVPRHPPAGRALPRRSPPTRPPRSAPT